MGKWEQDRKMANLLRGQPTLHPEVADFIRIEFQCISSSRIMVSQKKSLIHLFSLDNFFILSRF